MARPKNLIVEEYCSQFKEMKTYTLAKKIFEENPGLYKNLHSCRGAVAKKRAAWGNKNRHLATHPKPLNYDTTNSKPKVVNTSAKVLILDIETAPLMAFVWNIWQQNVGIHQIINDWFCFTWAAKWLFEDKVYSGRLTSKEALEKDDKRIMEGVWGMLNEADIVITHNGDKFDLPKLNTRFLLHGMKPVLPYQSIDTLKAVKRTLAFTSNKQEYINMSLGTARKVDTGGFELWDKCYKGDVEALKKMEEYNIGDVTSLEDNYLKLRSYIKPHPNMGLFILDEHERCPSCGSNELKETGKLYMTSVASYESLRCDNCGGVGRRRKSNLTVNEKRNILSSTPR